MAIDIQKFMNEGLPAVFAKNPDDARALGEKFQINITGDGGGEWFIDAHALSVKPGHGDHADATFTIATEDFHKLYEDPQRNGMQIFFAGKLRMSGDPRSAMKFFKLLSLGRD